VRKILSLTVKKYARDEVDFDDIAQIPITLDLPILKYDDLIESLEIDLSNLKKELTTMTEVSNMCQCQHRGECNTSKCPVVEIRRLRKQLESTEGRMALVESLEIEISNLKKELTTTPQPQSCGGIRKYLPTTRNSITHKFSISGYEGYLTVGMFDNGDPGELFIVMAKEGSTIGGLMDTIGVLTSLLLQYGVTTEKLREKFAHTRFEPSGHSKCKEIGEASSIPDYIFRWLDMTFNKKVSE